MWLIVALSCRGVLQILEHAEAAVAEHIKKLSSQKKQLRAQIDQLEEEFKDINSRHRENLKELREEEARLAKQNQNLMRAVGIFCSCSILFGFFFFLTCLCALF